MEDSALPALLPLRLNLMGGVWWRGEATGGDPQGHQAATTPLKGRAEGPPRPPPMVPFQSRGKELFRLSAG